MKQQIVFALGLVLASAGLSHAACTQADVQQKVIEVSQKAQALAATDPAKMQKVMLELQTAQQNQAATSLDEVCEIYDRLLADLDG